MANDTLITVTGGLTADPELRFSASGSAVANFTIASTPRRFDRQTNGWVDGDTLFMRCSVWKEYAEHVAESLKKGDRVLALGRLVQRSYETREGDKRTVMELQVEEIGPTLRFLTLPERQGSGGTTRGEAGRTTRSAPTSPDPDNDPWATPAPSAGGGAPYSDEPPF